MGAISALKGYRTQFLYSLYRILKDYKNNYIFKVEGEFEDLDILDSKNGLYLETIQVKNKNKVLNFSDLFSSNDSFFRRANKSVLKSPKVKLQIVSFGKVSQDLIDKIRLRKKLIKKGFSLSEIDIILDNYLTPKILDEVKLEEDVLNLIKDFSVFTDSKTALELLLFWMYKSAETQKEITTKDLIVDLNNIGKFLSERTSFHNQFGTTIIPISSKSLDNENKLELERGFYYGVSAKYEHILANLDVKRKEKLELINSSLHSKNIVFIHGASGQGKSTLAYRFLHEFGNDNLTYELKISNKLDEVFKTINALDGLCKGLKVPVIVYIDVSPQNTYWNEILKELGTKLNLKFVVTIRQEDWNRTVLGEDFDFKDIELVFNKDEAKVLYESLSNHKKDLKYIDFEESWLQFGNKGMLLEYVYFINEGDKLKTRLSNQVSRLEEEGKSEELEILSYVCLADTFNSKINFKKLVEFLGFNKRLSSSYIKHLEKEYLLKFVDNKNYITGLHPVRSKILCEILFIDDDYIEIDEYIGKSLSLIDDSDLHNFILNSFIYDYKVESLLSKLDDINLVSSTAYSKVFDALLWKGIYDFIFFKNIKIFNSLYIEYKGLWSFILPYDYSGVTDGSIHDLFKEHFPKEVNNRIRYFQNKFSDKEDIYEYILLWLQKSKTIRLEVKNSFDIALLGRFVFWLSHLNLEKEIIFNHEDLLKIIEKDNVTIENISELILGLKLYNYKEVFVNKLEREVLDKLRKRYSIISLEVSNNIDCIYFYNILEYSEDSDSENNYFHGKSNEIVKILRNIFPFKDKYNIRGVGKTLFGLDMPYDPSQKNIVRKNLPIPHLVQINSLINNLYSFVHRPNSWEDYNKLVLDNRRTYNLLSGVLIRDFMSYFKSNEYHVFKNSISKIEEKLKEVKTIPFPKNISDKWGYVSEGNEVSSNEINEGQNSDIKQNKSIALSKYKTFKKYQRDYFTSLENFFNQIGKNIVSLYKLQQGENNEDYNSGVLSVNIKNALLNHIAYSREYERLFYKFIPEKELNSLDKIEFENVEALFYAWKQLLNQKGKINNKIFKNASKSFVDAKTNLNKRVKSEMLKILNEFGLSFSIVIGDKALDKTMLLTADVNSEIYNASVVVARILIERTLKSDFFSFKKVIVDSNINSVVYIPLFGDKALNQNGYEIQLYNLEQGIEELSEGDSIFTYVNPLNKIDKKIIDYLDLEFWNNEISRISDYENVMGELVSIKELKLQVNHIKTIGKDDLGCLIISSYEKEIESFFRERMIDTISSFDKIKKLIDSDLSEKIHLFINNFKFEEIKINELEEVNQKLQENYYNFSENLIFESY